MLYGLGLRHVLATSERGKFDEHGYQLWHTNSFSFFFYLGIRREWDNRDVKILNGTWWNQTGNRLLRGLKSSTELYAACETITMNRIARYISNHN